MRIFVYLLALLTGFSAAHAAADSVSAVAAVDSAQAATSIVAAETAVAGDALAYAQQEYAVTTADISPPLRAAAPLRRTPRIYRGDRAQE